MPNENSLNPKTRTTVNPNTSGLNVHVLFEDIPFNNAENEVVLSPSPKINEIEILEDANYKNQVYGQEEELLMTIEKDVLLEIDIDGNLYISSEDAEQYDIDDNGELIYSFIDNN